MNEQDNNWASLLASEPPAEELAENVYSEDLHQNNTQKLLKLEKTFHKILIKKQIMFNQTLKILP